MYGGEEQKEKNVACGFCGTAGRGSNGRCGNDDGWMASAKKVGNLSLALSGASKRGTLSLARCLGGAAAPHRGRGRGCVPPLPSYQRVPAGAHRCAPAEQRPATPPPPDEEPRGGGAEEEEEMKRKARIEGETGGQSKTGGGYQRTGRARRRAARGGKRAPAPVLQRGATGSFQSTKRGKGKDQGWGERRGSGVIVPHHASVGEGGGGLGAGTRSRARCARVAGPHSWQAALRRVHRNAMLCAHARARGSLAPAPAPKCRAKRPQTGGRGREGESGVREGAMGAAGRPVAPPSTLRSVWTPFVWGSEKMGRATGQPLFRGERQRERAVRAGVEHVKGREVIALIV